MCWLGRVRCAITGRCPLIKAIGNWQLAIGSILFLVWHRLLCLWFLLLFLISRFSAVRDFGQELADALNVIFRPKVQAGFPGPYDPRLWHFPKFYVLTQGGRRNAQFRGSLTGRVRCLHSLTVSMIVCLAVKKISLDLPSPFFL